MASPLHRDRYTRAVKIYTRRGDSGETDLIGSGRVGKDDLRVEAYGAIDELNAAVGSCASATSHDDARAALQRVQRTLFSLGAYFATPEARHRSEYGMSAPEKAETGFLEERIDAWEAELPPLQRFVLPGGTSASAAFHVARTVCRRAERRVVSLSRAAELDASALRYINRLSDLLFVMARLENHRAGIPDVEWEGRKRP